MEVTFAVANGLGAVEYEPGRTYEPRVNVPTHALGGESGEAVITDTLQEAGGFEMALPFGIVTKMTFVDGHRIFIKE